MNTIADLKLIIASCGATLLLGISSAALAQTGQQSPSAQAGHGQEMKQGMENKQHKMDNMQMTGDADHDFATMMRSHHQDGIEMAEKELKDGKDPAMKAMAKKIVSDQKKEIAKLDKWMANHKPAKK